MKKEGFTFISIAPFIVNEQGHFFHYHLACQNAAEQLGWDFSAFIPKDAHLKKIPPRWIKWFDPQFRKKKKWRFFFDMKRLFCANDSSNRLFFLETFGRREFRFFSLAAFLFAKKNDRIAILYRDDLIYRKPKDKFTLSLFTFLLKFKFKDCFFALSDSEAIAEYFSKIFHKNLHLLPIPHTSENTPNPHKNEKIVCIWPGAPRKEKGIEIIKKLNELCEPTKEYFLCPKPSNPALPSDTYEELLHNCDIVFLPYDKMRYQRRTSGIFVEAIISRKMVLVSDGTWMAFELQKNNLGELIVDWNIPHFFKHIYDLYQNPQIQEKLNRMHEKYAAYHTQTSFANRLQEVFSL